MHEQTQQLSFFIIRPGALGDVVATRALYGFIRKHTHEAKISLAAPGERCRLFLSETSKTLADQTFDLSSISFTWLFSDEITAPATHLQDCLASADYVLAFLNDPHNYSANNLRAACSPACKILIHPARPDENGKTHIHDHLVKPLQEIFPASEEYKPAKITIPEEEINRLLPQYGLEPGKYAVIHPGSGSERKNWPLKHYCHLAKQLAASYRIVITGSEADRSLAHELSNATPNSILFYHKPLKETAAVVAASRLYIGNDSGVTHLACSVCQNDGNSPKTFALFGPTSPEVWAPPESTVIRAPQKVMESLKFEQVYRIIFSQL